MKQANSLLLLRLKQGYRFLRETGFLLIAIALFILTGFILSALNNIMMVPARATLIVIPLVLLGIEFKRKDTFFLKSIFDDTKALYLYKFLENLCIVMPLLVFQAIFLRWAIVASIIGVTAIVSTAFLFIKLSRRENRKRSLEFIPLSLFEVRFYIEKRLWSMCFVFLLLCLGAFHISLWILGMVLLCTLPLDIFTHMEPREMMHYQPHFVLEKLRINIGFFLMIILLPAVLTLYFSTSFYVVVIYSIIALILCIALAIGKKYSAYFGVQPKVPSSTSTMILVFLMLAPGGILITLTACIYYYFKAEKHMKHTYAIL